MRFSPAACRINSICVVSRNDRLGSTKRRPRERPLSRSRDHLARHCIDPPRDDAHARSQRPPRTMRRTTRDCLLFRRSRMSFLCFGTAFAATNCVVGGASRRERARITARPNRWACSFISPTENRSHPSCAHSLATCGMSGRPASRLLLPEGRLSEALLHPSGNPTVTSSQCQQVNKVARNNLGRQAWKSDHRIQLPSSDAHEPHR